MCTRGVWAVAPGDSATGTGRSAICSGPCNNAALGPDFKKGHVVKERVQRRDLVPTITYVMTGENAEYATGHVRTQLFKDEYRMPAYVLPPTAEVGEGAPAVDKGELYSRRTMTRSRNLVAIPLPPGEELRQPFTGALDA